MLSIVIPCIGLREVLIQSGSSDCWLLQAEDDDGLIVNQQPLTWSSTGEKESTGDGEESAGEGEESADEGEESAGDGEESAGDGEDDEEPRFLLHRICAPQRLGVAPVTISRSNPELNEDEDTEEDDDYTVQLVCRYPETAKAGDLPTICVRYGTRWWDDIEVKKNAIFSPRERALFTRRLEIDVENELLKLVDDPESELNREAAEISLKAVRVPDQWAEALGCLRSKVSNVIAVAGQKGVGKSTFCRLLANKLRDAQDAEVYYLDTDLGQPEFTAPGFVSLHKITSPLVHTDGSVGIVASFSSSCLEVVEKQFVGAATPQDCPQAYLKAVARCCRAFRDIAMEANSPTARAEGSNRVVPAQPKLVVNLMGWTSGLGFHFCRTILNLAQATDLVRIGFSDGDLKKMAGDDMEACPFDEEELFELAGNCSSSLSFLDGRDRTRTLRSAEININQETFYRFRYREQQNSGMRVLDLHSARGTAVNYSTPQIGGRVTVGPGFDSIYDRYDAVTASDTGKLAQLAEKWYLQDDVVAAGQSPTQLRWIRFQQHFDKNYPLETLPNRSHVD